MTIYKIVISYHDKFIEWNFIHILMKKYCFRKNFWVVYFFFKGGGGVVVVVLVMGVCVWVGGDKSPRLSPIQPRNTRPDRTERLLTGT